MDKIDKLLTKRVDKIYPSKKALEKVLRSGKKLKLYLGIDPTASKLHLGHTIPIRKLQEFVNLGHEVILLFGTGTVLVGDPSEREKGRRLITEKEVKKNIATWKKQIKPFIDFKKVKIKYNGDWIIKLSIKEIIKLGSQVTAVQLFKRKSFSKRIKNGDTVWYYETLYPLLQGYDSVKMNVDLEVGGTDQTFNMLIGRQLQKKINHKEKFVMTTKMILGTNGKTMSKTSNNCIWLTDTPQNIFGKIMNLQDQLIPSYFEAFTNNLPANINKVNPMELKKQLALNIIKQIYNQKKAIKAKKEFERVFANKKTPTKIKSLKIKTKKWNIIDLLIKAKLIDSRSKAKRLIKQKAVKINKLTIENYQLPITIKSGDILQVGKRRWIKIK